MYFQFFLSLWFLTFSTFDLIVSSYLVLYWFLLAHFEILCYSFVFLTPSFWHAFMPVGMFYWHLLSFFFSFFCLLIFWGGGGAETEKDRESEAGSAPTAASPNAGLELMNPEIMTRVKVGSLNWLSHPGAPLFFLIVALNCNWFQCRFIC